VILAALYGGLRVGLLATGLSALAATFFLIEPVGQFAIRDPADWLGLGVFLMSCTAISWFTDAMQRAQARAGEAEAQVKLAIERGRAEEELRRYKLLAEHSRDVILYMRRDDGLILEANAAAARLYGYTHDELQSLSIHQLRADDAPGLAASQMAEADTAGILFETFTGARTAARSPSRSVPRARPLAAHAL
jgi:PAS domain-containing protein